MTNRDRIINSLNEISHYNCEQMFYNDIFIRGIADDAIAILKKQEPVKVKDCADIVDRIQVGYCPKCDRKIVWNPEKEGTVAFCKYCGQAVKWNET